MLDVHHDQPEKLPDEALIEVAPGVQLPRNAWCSRSQAVLTPEIIELIAQLHRSLDAESALAQPHQFDRRNLRAERRQVQHQ